MRPGIGQNGNPASAMSDSAAHAERVIDRGARANASDNSRGSRDIERSRERRRVASEAVSGLEF
jgi:hypothetical protein